MVRSRVRRWHRILGAALLLPLLIVASSSSAFAAMRCQRAASAVEAGCCCPKRAAGAEDSARADRETPAHPGRGAGAGASVGAPGCCRIERGEVEKAPSEPPRPQLLLDLAAAETPVGVIAHSLRAEGLPGRGWTQPARAPDGRLTLLRKRSFLI